MTGIVSIDNLFHATLTSRGRVYELMVPRNLVYQSGVQEGSRITVEGYAVQGRPMGSRSQSGNNAIALFVTKATIDGRDYDLSQYRGRKMGSYGDDPRGNRRGGSGRGPRGGMMNGGGNGQDNGRDYSQGYGQDGGRDYSQGF